MTIVNFGSCCIDNVYQVPHFVHPGETLSCSGYEIHPGGKGLNQSLALAQSGAKVMHIGKLGADGQWLKALLHNAGVDVARLEITDAPTGHANIQVTPEGQNSIVIVAGANKLIEPGDVASALSATSAKDIVLLQNETSCTSEIMQMAADQNLRTAFNAAPFTAAVDSYPLALLEYLLVNEVEGEGLTGKSDPQQILDELASRFPDVKIVLTLGAAGVFYKDASQQLFQAAYPVQAKDTTGAGDTFTGFFLAGIELGLGIAQCLENACKAAAISVTRQGAATSIPKLSELESFTQ